jgi:chaperonin cofactor prefoldin
MSQEKSREEVRREAEEYIRRLEQLLRDIRKLRMRYRMLQSKTDEVLAEEGRRVPD